MVRLAKDACVVPGRSCRAESIPVVLGHDLVDSFNCSAGRDESCLPRLLRSDSVLAIKVFNPLITSPSQLGDVFHHFLDVVKVVNFKQIGDLSPLIYMLLDAHRSLSLLKLDTVCEKAEFFIDE